MAALVIAADPNKVSATIEVLDERERVLGGGRQDVGRSVGGESIICSARCARRARTLLGKGGLART